MVFVCEEKNEIIEGQLTEIADAIFDDLHKENLLGFLKQSEANMYKNYHLPDTKCCSSPITRWTSTPTTTCRLISEK